MPMFSENDTPRRTRNVPLAAWVFVWLGLILTFCAAVYAVPPLAIVGAACTISALIVGWE